MRFYLDFPLIVGYVMMAISGCIGVLQYTAARGGYDGLSLFTANQKRGQRIGVALTVCAVLVYVLFAPEILTPGPAGSEVAVMFAVCALVALAITLFGADLRISRAGHWPTDGHKQLNVGGIPAMLFQPPPTPPGSGVKKMQPAPTMVLLPDPTGFFSTPNVIIDEACRAGLAVLVLNVKDVSRSSVPLSLSVSMVLRHASATVSQLKNQRGIDADRLGLLGVGIGGDLALNLACTDGFKHAVAVSPIMLAPLKPGTVLPGLHWLHELSYRQVWNWRRHWSEFVRTASALSRNQITLPKHSSESALEHTSYIIATRSSGAACEPLKVRSRRYFSLMDDETACQLVVQWCKEALESKALEGTTTRLCIQ